MDCGMGPFLRRTVHAQRTEAAAHAAARDLPVNCLLDTNACIALINGRPESVRAHLWKALEAGASVWVPCVAAFELWYGVAKSSRPELNRQRLETFFAGPLSLLSFEEQDAQVAGKLR